MTLFLAWILVLQPPTQVHISQVLLIAIGPLMFPLRGLLHAKTYTHSWCSFLSLAYFIHAVVEAYTNEQTRYLALVELLLSCGLFFGCVYYVRMTAIEKNNKA